MTLEGNEGNRVIGTPNSSQIHILQTFPDWPAESGHQLDLPGQHEHSVFIPFFSGITDTADAYKVDGDTYDASGAYWKFKRIDTLAELDRSLYSESVRKFWKFQEEDMYQQMLDAAPVMLEKYAESSEAGDAYVTQLGIQMAEYAMTCPTTCSPSCTPASCTTLAAADRVAVFLADVPCASGGEPRLYRHLECRRRLHHHRQGCGQLHRHSGELRLRHRLR